MVSGTDLEIVYWTVLGRMMHILALLSRCSVRLGRTITQFLISYNYHLVRYSYELVNCNDIRTESAIVAYVPTACI